MNDEGYELLRLDNQICFPLYAATNLINRLYRPLLAKVGLTYPQYIAMMALWERSPMPMGALCDRLFLDSGTLTPLLKRLEKTGYIARRRDPEDERRMIVSLTDEGDRLREAASEIPRALLEKFDAAGPELVLFRELLQATVAGLHQKLQEEQGS
ncbi:transcriptional regulator, MarR family [Verrucomicrobiia bacterium DG1235]|nr:transcriptional regulator, MarR family [Verrucomicrobiae bacterium DG1235]